MLDEVVREAVENWGDAICLVGPDGWSLTYRDLDRISDEVAVGMAEAGVGEGDVVVLQLPTSPDHVVAYAACAKLGAICAGVNPRLTDAEQDAVVARAAPALVIGADQAGRSAADMLRTIR